MMIRRQLLSPTAFGMRNIRQMVTSCVRGHKAVAHKSNNQFSENVDIHCGSDEHKIGDEPQHDYIHTSSFQRFMLSVGSSVAALLNPHRLLLYYLYFQYDRTLLFVLLAIVLLLPLFCFEL